MAKNPKKPSDNEPPSLFDNFPDALGGEKPAAPEAKPAEKPAEKPAAPAPAAPAAGDGDETEAEGPGDASNTHGGEGPLRELMNDNFLQYAAYTICDRAIPTAEDGLKPVQRRILHSLYEMDDGRFIKVANVVGHTMQYHPHGDASIGDAIVVLANKRYLIQGQGNYGNIYTGDPAAAPRYIECRLTELARKEVFNPKITAYIPSYDGRNQEPVLLPTKLPLVLMLGADGLAVGLSTTILSHNFIELLEAEIAIIQKKPFKVYPDFLTGGIIDVSEYQDGFGKLKIRAAIEKRPGNKLAIIALPAGWTTDALIDDIEANVKKKKVPVREINDFTAEKVEIELTLTTGTSQDQAIQALYAFTACETSITSHPVVLYKNRPVEMSVSDLLRINTEQLMSYIKRELEIRQRELDDLFHEKTMEQIFIEERIYKRIEEQTSYEAVQQAVLKGFVPFRKRLRRDVTLDDVEKLLQIKIRRISRYDIDKNRQEIEGILKEEAEVAGNLKGLRGYTTAYLRGLIKEYKKSYPRLTQVSEKPFVQAELRKLTASELSIRIDPEGHYIGTDVRGGEELFKCSSLDKLLIVWADGRYKVIPPPDKFFVDKDHIYCGFYTREKLFTAVYTEPEYGFTYIKRFAFGGLIQNKEYRFAPEKSAVRLFVEGTPEALYLKYKPVRNQRIHQQQFTPSEALVKGVTAKGVQLTSKDISRVAVNKPQWWDDSENSPKGVLS